MAKVVQITNVITHCSQCPYCEMTRQYTEDSFEEEYNLRCTKTGRLLYKYLDWYEIRTMFTPAKPEYDSARDVVPDNCPLATENKPK